jgi:hypothetical protein
MTCSDKAISPLIAWSATNQNTGVLLFVVDFGKCLRASKSGEFHELVKAERASCVHQLFVDLYIFNPA